MIKINKKCLENNLTFMGFNNEEKIYKNNRTKLILKCNKCGYIWDSTSYDKFVSRKSKCPKCTNKKHLTKNELKERIIKRCHELNYKFIDFKNNKNINITTKIILKCEQCGKIWDTTTITNFLRPDRKSHKCGKNNPYNMPSIYKTKNEVIKEIKQLLINTNLEFINFEGEYAGIKKCKIKIRCKICEKEYTISYRTLKQNSLQKCKYCQYNGKFNNEYVIKTIKEKCMLLNYEFLGFNTFDERYNGKNTKLILKCNKCGRIWKTTSYYNFIHSTIKCLGCINSWKLEKEVKMVLDKNKIEYEEQKTFDWLRNKTKLSLDFYLPKYNIFIECQGRQHFIPVSTFGGEKGFEETKKRDLIKYQKCIEHGIIPLYYSNKKWKYCNGEKTINDLNKLIDKIKNG